MIWYTVVNNFKIPNYVNYFKLKLMDESVLKHRTIYIACTSCFCILINYYFVNNFKLNLSVSFWGNKENFIIKIMTMHCFFTLLHVQIQ